MRSLPDPKPRQTQTTDNDNPAQMNYLLKKTLQMETSRIYSTQPPTRNIRTGRWVTFYKQILFHINKCILELPFRAEMYCGKMK